MVDTKADYLSKSLFIEGLQCRKALYLHKFKPELKDEVTLAREAVFESGREIGRRAQNLFPGGVEIEYDGYSAQEQLDRTRHEIKKGTKVLYEPAFSHDGVFFKADIMRRVGDSWELYEVKGATSVKDVYLEDISIQYYVLKGCGIPIKDVYLAYINNKYVRDGELDVNQLFTIEKQTRAVEENQENVKKALKEMRSSLRGGLPQIDIGEYCDDPYPCDFRGHCWKHIPKNSVFDLKGNGAKKFDLYRASIVHMKDIPRDWLNFHQGIQVACTLEKKNYINAENIKEFLNTLQYPLSFLDFETFQSAVPLFSGTSPYQQITFQYSLHVIQDKDKEPVHYEYLARPNSDPREELVEQLLSDIPRKGSVLVYTSFEKTRLNELADWLPGYAAEINSLTDRIIDLAAPFRKKDLYLWQMCGSHSIKEVLPALVPDMNYSGLEISDGGMAMSAYFEMRESKDPEKVERIRKNLLEYCGMDTLAMVKVLPEMEKWC